MNILDNNAVVVLKLSEEHISDVYEIERASFSSPWSESSLMILTREGGIGFVAIIDDKVVGYVGMMTVLDEGQITNVAVLPEYRGRGVGLALVLALSQYAMDNAINTLYLEVRRSNLPAISLYEKCGFLNVGTRKGFYSMPVEDAFVYKKDVIR